MKNLLLLAVCLFSINAFAETKFNINGDAYVRGYFLNGTGPDYTQAFNHFFRINSDIKTDEHLTLKTGLVLAAETWEGDTRTPIATNGTATTGTNEDKYLTKGNDNITHLDHAVIEYNKDGMILSAGRHAVSTPGCFLTCDDRRDRIQFAKFMANYDLFAIAYDKRSEGSLTNSRDDLDMITVAYYGSLPIFKYALQAGYFSQKKPDLLNNLALNGVKQFTPQISGKYYGIDYNIYYSILFGGSELYKDSHHSGALRLTKDFDFAKVDFESVVTMNGGLVVNGFDTLSSVINNSPDHNQSSIRLKSIGLGIGRSNADEYTHMIKLSKNLTSDLLVSVGGGFARLYNYGTTEATSHLETDSILDLTAKYTVSKNLNLALAYGKFFGDNQDHAGSASLNANF